MKKRYLYITTILLSAVALSLSSCLKNSNNYIDFSKAGTIVEFPKGGLALFSSDAVTDPGDTITKQFAVTVASNNVPTTATTITFSFDDPAIITAYNTSNTAVSYLPMPANAFVSPPTSVTIPAGQRTAILSITFYKGLLDPSKSYMLPIAIKSAGGLNISTNMGIHYYHFIGNDFAGPYIWDYYRYNAATVLPTPSGGTTLGQAGVISPVTPTEFQMVTGYNGQGVRYDVTYTRTVVGGTPMYSNFAVSFVPADVTGIWGAAGITIIQQPVFYNPPFNPAGPLTFAQAVQIFRFQYIDFNGTADRFIIDYYH